MVQAIEQVIVIPPDGKLPETFREAFGRKAQVIVLLSDKTDALPQPTSATHLLTGLSGKIQAFRDIEDPVSWQRTLRDEWSRDWER